ncbi:unnamed protein product [Fraxinus pennsylvanica]|uniref:NB-ARC domain-containing protein n=1 Tax=Fraxinus pennsylvanica TaxID=56036 RepID=A0AAD2E4U4_9LAMI|nr:unnamed protein product [Fraxinus pennsylvanica]
MEVLSEEEAWILFMNKHSYGIRLPPKVEEIAREVVKKCASLPLAIITIAGSLRVEDEGEDSDDDPFTVIRPANVFCMLRCYLDPPSLFYLSTNFCNSFTSLQSKSTTQKNS